MKRILIAAGVMLLLSGCGRDAASLTVVTGISVDGTEGNYSVCAEVIRLEEENDTNQSLILKAAGSTVTEGIERMVSMTGRSLYCNHAQVLVIGRETAQNGIAPLLKELLAGTQYPVSLRLAVAENDAESVLRAKSVVGGLHSTEMRDAIHENAQRCISPDAQICKFYEQCLLEGIAGILPVIGLLDNSGEAASAITGTAVFSGDRLTLLLNAQESACLLWMRGQRGGTFSFGNTVFSVKKVHRKLCAEPSGADMHLSFCWNIRNQELFQETMLRRVEQSLSRSCDHLLKRLQEHGCDAVGFGEELRQTYPNEWRRMQTSWPLLFRSYPLRLHVSSDQIVWGRIVSCSVVRQEVNPRAS